MSPSSGKKPKLKLTTRADPERLPGFRLTERDREIIQTVYAFRVMTTPQIERLLFPPEPGRDHPTKTSRCQYRLKLLYHAGYLKRDEQPQKLSEGRKPLVYFLDQKGAELIADLEGKPVAKLDWNPTGNIVSWLFLDHLLATNDVRTAIVAAARVYRFKIEEWFDEQTLKSAQMKDYVTLKGEQGGERQAAVIPDGYFRLRAGEYVYHHFLEIDRRTVTGEAADVGRRDWARKAKAYLEYYRSGKYQQRYHTQGLRILTVTTGERRLAHLKAITEKVGGKARFWFTTFERITPQTVLTEPIWEQAGKEGNFALTW
jgi:hypothetical protein